MAIFLSKGFSQFPCFFIFRNMTEVDVVGVEPFEVASMFPAHPFDEVGEVFYEKAGVGATGGDEEDGGFICVMQFVFFSFCESPEAVHGDFEEAAVGPEEEGCGEDDDICFPVGVVDVIHVVLLGAWPFRIHAAVKAAEAGGDFHLPEVEDSDPMAFAFCPFSEGGNHSISESSRSSGAVQYKDVHFSPFFPSGDAG